MMMMKLTVVVTSCLLVASTAAAAAAFAPPAALQTKKAASTLMIQSAFSDAIGVTDPVGFYDPIGLLKNADQAKFDRLRYVELKHGRISMLAVVGYIATITGNRLPGTIDLSGTSFADIPAGFASLTKVPAAGLCQMLFFVGLLETSFMRDWTGKAESPGDFRNNYIDFGWDTFDATEKTRQLNAEINQGRAAMMGIFGLMVHDQLGNVDTILPFKLV